MTIQELKTFLIQTQINMLKKKKKKKGATDFWSDAKRLRISSPAAPSGFAHPDSSTD